MKKRILSLLTACALAVFTFPMTALAATELTLDMVKPGLAALIYNGEPQELPFTIVDGDTVLEAGTDYHFMYDNHTFAGSEANIQIHGKGNYQGSSVTYYYTIAPAPIEIELADSEANGVFAYTGRPVTPGVSVYDLYNDRPVTSGYHVKYENNTAIGTATARITSDNYTEAELTFEIVCKHTDLASDATVCTVCNESIVAAIGSTGYTDLRAAFEDADSSSITARIQLKSDIALTEILNLDNVKAELDLNGHTISFDKADMTDESDLTAIHLTTGELTILDTSAEKDGSITVSNDNAFFDCLATCIDMGGNWEEPDEIVSKLTIKSGSFYAETGSAYHNVHAIHSNPGSSVTIEDGSFEAVGLYSDVIQAQGDLKITGGTFEGGTALTVFSDAEITGGKFIAHEKSFTDPETHESWATGGQGICIGDGGDFDPTVELGAVEIVTDAYGITFNSGNITLTGAPVIKAASGLDYVPVSFDFCNQTCVTLDCDLGDNVYVVIGTGNVPLITPKAGVTLSLANFTTRSDYHTPAIVDGSLVLKMDEICHHLNTGASGICPDCGNHCPASLLSEGYLSFFTNVEQLESIITHMYNDGYDDTCTIKLLDDIAFPSGFTFSEDHITIDLNGHTISSTEANWPAITPQLNADLTIIDSVGTGTVYAEDNPSGCISTWGIPVNATKDAKLTIKGGVYDQRIAIGGTLTITGGKFAFDPSAYVPSGYEVKQSGGYYAVSKTVAPPADDDDRVPSGSASAPSTENSKGWDDITEEIGTAGSTAVDMGSSTTVPSEVLDTMASADSTVSFETKKGTWTIDGSSVPADVKDVDLTVKTSSSAPKALKEEAKAAESVVNVRLDDSFAESGIEANLTVDAGEKSAGKSADIYVMDENGEAKLLTSVPVGADGKVDLPVGGAEQYVCVINEKGSLEPGWQKNADGQWLYGTETGTAAAGWVKDGSNWYLMSGHGFMQTGWQKDTDGSWYYLHNSGAMKTGWLKDTDGSWYYLQGSGSMKANGWIQSGGEWYYVGPSGAMLTDTVTPDGYRVDASGKWIR